MKPIETPLTTPNGHERVLLGGNMPPTRRPQPPPMPPCRDCGVGHLPSEHCAVSAVPCPACFGPHAPGACPAMIYRPVAMLNCLLAYVGGLCTGVALTALYFTVGR